MEDGVDEGEVGVVTAAARHRAAPARPRLINRQPETRVAATSTSSTLVVS